MAPAKEPVVAQAKVLREVVRSYSYVLIWMSISIAVILFNKWLLAYSGFPFPIALTLWHMIFCSTVGFLAVRVFKVVKSHNMTPREYYTRVMPIGARVRRRGQGGIIVSFWRRLVRWLCASPQQHAKQLVEGPRQAGRQARRRSSALGCGACKCTMQGMPKTVKREGVGGPQQGEA